MHLRVWGATLVPMIKGLFIFLGIGFLIVLAVGLFFGFMVWNHERGYPKSILAEEEKGVCLVSTQSFVLLKRPRGVFKEKVFVFLPKPEQVDFIYSGYVPGTYLDADGKEQVDLTDHIEVSSGTRFTLKDGFQNRTLNDTEFFYWLEPDGMALDSSFFVRSIGLGKTVEEMGRFDEGELFARDCEEGADL